MYDAIVVGARCAGSSVSMLLARMGHRVLLVDRATFPSDTISTQFIWPPGVDCLNRWGLLDRLRAADTPPITELGLDLGVFQLKGVPPPCNGSSEMFAPRRTLLDKLLVDGAAEAGVEVAEGFTVDDIAMADGRVAGIRGRRRDGAVIEERAAIVIGADGRHSIVARAAGAESYNVRPVVNCCYYSYWRDVPPHRVTIRARPNRFLVTSPANDGLTIVTAMFPIAEFAAIKGDIDRHFMAAVELVPKLADLLRGAQRVERYYGTGDIENFFRKPYGEGWALAGDAGYHKDPCTAQDITDAFRSAEWLADAVHAGLSGARPFDAAMAEYHRVRDAHFLPMYELTYGLAHFAPPPAEIQALYAALRSNPLETDRFFGTMAGTVPIPEFYAPENVGRIVSRAAAAGD
jgi:flavin-dependent dehydrogenase